MPQPSAGSLDAGAAGAAFDEEGSADTAWAPVREHQGSVGKTVVRLLFPSLPASDEIRSLRWLLDT